MQGRLVRDDAEGALADEHQRLGPDLHAQDHDAEQANRAQEGQDDRQHVGPVLDEVGAPILGQVRHQGELEGEDGPDKPADGLQREIRLGRHIDELRQRQRDEEDHGQHQHRQPRHAVDVAGDLAPSAHGEPEFGCGRLAGSAFHSVVGGTTGSSVGSLFGHGGHIVRRTGRHRHPARRSLAAL